MSVLTNPRISWNGVQYTTQARQMNLSFSVEEVDDTVFGDDTRSREGGLKDWGADVEFLASESTSGGNTKDLFEDMGTVQTLAFRPTTQAIASTNPEYTGSALLTSMEPLAGNVGDQRVNPASWVSAGTLSRNQT